MYRFKEKPWGPVQTYRQIAPIYWWPHADRVSRWFPRTRTSKFLKWGWLKPKRKPFTRYLGGSYWYSKRRRNRYW